MSQEQERAQVQYEPVTVERVERGRTRLLALAEMLMGSAEAALSCRGESPPTWLQEFWLKLGPRYVPVGLGEAAMEGARNRVEDLTIKYARAVRTEICMTVQAAASCFTAAATDWSSQSSASAVEWSRDPAASGPRSRTWLGGKYELVAYDVGEWELHGPPIGVIVASGSEVDVEAAKRRALEVYRAFTAPLGAATGNEEPK